MKGFNVSRKLLNYSIETDHLVLLHFSDGESQRVAFDQIADHLTGADLVKVNRAIKLRKDFFRHNNLPGSLAVAVAVGLAVVLVADYHGVAGLWKRSQPVDSAPAAASHAQAISTPEITVTPPPTPTPSLTPSSPAAAQAPAGDRPSAVPPVPAAPPANAVGLQLPLPTPALHVLEKLPITVPKLQ